MDTITLEAKDICVDFPGVKALAHVDFQLLSGEIHALVGANGAGKSTLMKVLAGANPGYRGDIRLDGEAVELRSPGTAKRLGIQIVYQEVDQALAPALSAAENMLLDELGKPGRLWVDWRALYRQAEQLKCQLRMDFDVRMPVSRLTLAQKQMVLIARALHSRCRILLLDEPTAPLSTVETETLFALCRDLVKERRISIVFISHRLPEVLGLCDRYTVLLGGKLAASGPITPQTTAGELVAHMLGGEMETARSRLSGAPGGELLSVHGLSSRDGSLRDISLTVRHGEIIGLAGLVGAGKSELCKALFGILPRASGEILLDGRPVNPRCPADGAALGMGLVPEERRKEGLFPGESVSFHLGIASLKQWSRLSFLSSRRLEQNARTQIERLEIKTPSTRQRMELLSGGNQQKAVVGKWLAAGCRLYLLDEPTKGVDVGAKAEMLRLMTQLAQAGCGVLYASADPSELLQVTDRIYVLYGGSIAAELVTARTSEEEITYYAVGGKAPFLPPEQRERGTQS
ncbi:sugar ABC transporter ATP-binding protein [uncultured Intestinimonas sp.]|uniref:sugar ABC transporter ATP-binding protein n=1 Tax=uncultured Intestinimonas sp. TaxID=1689265 RepID=UPI0025EC0AC4|nr:sugar ABC transporter ATP-binding protein [uncultured Intestinimonas sp.]